MTTTRRTILAGLSALPIAPVYTGVATAAVLPRVAHAASADPTFELIERHQAAWDAFGAALSRDDGDGVELEDQAEQDAMEALLTPEPTTLAGLRALAEYMFAHEERCNIYKGDWNTAQWALATLAEACRRLIPSRIGGAA